MLRVLVEPGGLQESSDQNVRVFVGWPIALDRDGLVIHFSDVATRRIDRT